MKIIVLSSQNYDDSKNSDYGDCFMIDYETGMLIFDCGSEEHAKRVIEYAKRKEYEKIDVILSHNDSDHFRGIPYLIEQEMVGSIYTVLLLKYVDKILDKIDDGRKNRETIKKQILEKYNNIAELSGQDLRDAIVETDLESSIKIVGPNEEYFLEAAAKAIDSTESDSLDGESVSNAASIQLEIPLSDGKILLCGDSNYEAIKDKITDYDIIQLPHHGNSDTASKIFEDNKGRNFVVYLVSDNKGSATGGSDDLPTSGYDIRNTKLRGDIEIGNHSLTVASTKSYGN